MSPTSRAAAPNSRNLHTLTSWRSTGRSLHYEMNTFNQCIKQQNRRHHQS
jgi:hypothetical protein